MTTYAARAARPPARTYLSQTGKEPLDEVDGIKGVRAFRIYSMPHPIHYAIVSRAHDDAIWQVKFTSVFPTRTYSAHLHTHADALARDLVGRKAAYDMQTYSGAQRLYMGTQRCPRRVASGLCGAAPEVGTVWCAWHPLGQMRPLDA